MNRCMEVMERLQAVSKNPGEALRRELDAGRRVVGVFPVYAPEELIYAAGLLPFGLWGGSRQIVRARASLPPFACSIMQSIMEQQLAGVYDGLEAVVIPSLCDTLKCMGQKWKGKCPAIQFTHPQNRVVPGAVSYLAEEYRGVLSRLEQLAGRAVADDEISHAIEIYNGNRRVMREFCELAARYPLTITSVIRHHVIRSRHYMDKAEHTALVRELIQCLQAMPEEKSDGKRIILTGISAEPDALLEILQENGFIVVGDDLAQESRQYRVDVPEGENTLERLAMAWQLQHGCSLAGDPRRLHGPLLVDMAERLQADGVIVCMMKFCDPEEFDYAVYNRQLQQAGVRHLYLEIDQQTVSFEQARVRIQSFAETL